MLLLYQSVCVNLLTEHIRNFSVLWPTNEFWNTKLGKDVIGMTTEIFGPKSDYL